MKNIREKHEIKYNINYKFIILETKKVLTLQTHTSIWIKFVLKNEQNFGVEIYRFQW